MRGQQGNAAGWSKGLDTAIAEGRAAGRHPDFTPNANPYRREEHRRAWDYGFNLERHKDTTHGL